MARIRRSRRCACPSPSDHAGVDRLSALPDDLLRLILGRLDTRTALSTAVLASRWARLPRELHALQLRVSDILPRRYRRLRHRALATRRRDHGTGTGCDAASAAEIDALVTRCERRAMRAFSDGIAGLLGSDDDGHGGGDPRCAKRLCLEFFPTEESSGCVDRLIPTAVGTWGVEDLEVVAVPPLVNHYQDKDDGGAAYTFPHHCLDDELHRSRLRSLTLGNCTVPPLYRYGALKKLVLRDMPASTPMATYQRLFTAGSPLEVLHLQSCRCTGKGRRLVISAPNSQLKELVVAGCSFLAIELRTLPMLERLACLTNTVELRFGAVPRLGHVNLAFSRQSSGGHDALGCFLENAPTVGSLAVRFTGPKRWITPRPLETKLWGLRQLLVADVPSSWDVTWPRLLLQAAPSLEVLHIHVAHHPAPAPPPGREISWQWQRSRFQHRHLKEVVLVGFERTLRQISMVRYLARVCRSLERVVLLKDWRVRETMGLWGWEVVPPEQECPWSEVEKTVVRKQVKYGRTWCRPLLEVIVE